MSDSPEAPEGFLLEHNAIPSHAWSLLEKWLQDYDKWEEHSVNQHRPVAQFGGCKYDYHNDVVVMVDSTTKSGTPPIPEIFERLLLHPVREILPDICFTQCIINDYIEASTIIPWHKDDAAFGDTILVYTFLDGRPLHLRCNTRKPDDDATTTPIHDDRESTLTYTAYPRHCSRYILRGSARENWEHSVPGGKGRRVSFTFRTLRSAK
jgi:alkylated DNA repair dioxygenase AlkB